MHQAATIHVAHSIHRKGGLKTFRAVAVVTNAGMAGHHTHRVAVDDTAAEAEARAIGYVNAAFERDGLPNPSATVHHGWRPGIDIDQVSFAPRRG